MQVHVFLDKLCSWASSEKGLKFGGPRASEFGLQLVVFLADNAVHPIVQVLVILFLLLFFSGIITLMVMVGNLCALLFTSGGILHLVCMQLSQIVPSFSLVKYI